MPLPVFLAGLALTIASTVCAAADRRHEPDMDSLGRTIYQVLLDLGEEQKGRTLVIGKLSLEGLPAEAREALTARLDEQNSDWIVGESYRDMPGEWREDDRHGLVNLTHLFVDFKTELRGPEVTLTYMRLYCGTCGSGGEAKLTWDGQSWHSEVVVRRYL